MTALFLALLVVALFATLLVSETSGEDETMRWRPAGLLTWLVSGNWPAKVGAGLIIVGVGALLRYAFANIDVPPALKLGSGATLSAALGLAAMWVKQQPQRRAIHLALAGAAFGVAYLTAYSAYGFFNYLTSVNALALLALVAAAAGVFAVRSNVMSVAILAMVGAYLAPKFALGEPSVLTVYGYFLAASILSLVMVTLRGWRPLIHLSFLFTLAGALFFGWSGRFYEAQYYAQMQPLLLALTLVHVLMPLLERKHSRSGTLAHFDSVYFVLLPLVAALLTLKIAPDSHTQGALGLAMLAVLWGVTAALLVVRKQAEATRHGLVALALAGAAAFCYLHDVPWLLVGLGVSVALLAAAPRLGWSRSIEELCSAAAAFFGVLHIINSIVLPVPAQAFLNEVFAHRLIAGSLLLLGAWLGNKRNIAFAQLLLVAGGGWLVLSVVSELLRLHIDYLAQWSFGLVLLAIAAHCVFGKKLSAHAVFGGWLILALICTGWWAAADAAHLITLVYLALTPLALLSMTWAGRDGDAEEYDDFVAAMAIGLLPFALLPWAISAADVWAIKTSFFEATFAMLGIGLAGIAARLWLSASPRWNDSVQPLHVYLTAFVLLYVTLFHIERGIWPVAFEVLALSYLIVYVTRRHREQAQARFGVDAMLVMAVALVMQAMLLRAFGPDIRVMDAFDINQMHLPAVASLMWVIFGAGLTGLATRKQSRAMWSAGAVLLVVAAVKLVLFDFGTLGQLGNIVAFIAAGVVFMGVAWLAPIPVQAKELEARPIVDARINAASPVERLALPSELMPQVKVADGKKHYKKSNGIWVMLLLLALIVSLILTIARAFTRDVEDAQYPNLGTRHPHVWDKNSNSQQGRPLTPAPSVKPQNSQL